MCSSFLAGYYSRPSAPPAVVEVFQQSSAEEPVAYCGGVSWKTLGLAALACFAGGIAVGAFSILKARALVGGAAGVRQEVYLTQISESRARHGGAHARRRGRGVLEIQDAGPSAAGVVP